MFAATRLNATSRLITPRTPDSERAQKSPSPSASRARQIGRRCRRPGFRAARISLQSQQSICIEERLAGPPHSQYWAACKRTWQPISWGRFSREKDAYAAMIVALGADDGVS